MLQYSQLYTEGNAKHLEAFHLEIHPDGCFVVLIKKAFTKPHKHKTMADKRNSSFQLQKSFSKGQKRPECSLTAPCCLCWACSSWWKQMTSSLLSDVFTGWIQPRPDFILYSIRIQSCRQCVFLRGHSLTCNATDIQQGVLTARLTCWSDRSSQQQHLQPLWLWRCCSWWKRQ